MALSDEIEKLKQLRDTGALSEDEFSAAKAGLLSGQRVVAASSDLPANQWGFFLHLSQLAGMAIPVAGFVIPVVIWQIKKNDYAILDEHGRNAMNWIISALIYAVACSVLCIVGVGFLGLLVLVVLGFVFPTIAAIKANNGEVWKYPLTIEFFK